MRLMTNSQKATVAMAQSKFDDLRAEFDSIVNNVRTIYGRVEQTAVLQELANIDYKTRYAHFETWLATKGLALKPTNQILSLIFQRVP